MACGPCPPIAQKSSLPQGQEGHAELDPRVLAAPEDAVCEWARVSAHQIARVRTREEQAGGVGPAARRQENVKVRRCPNPVSLSTLLSKVVSSD